MSGAKMTKQVFSVIGIVGVYLMLLETPSLAQTSSVFDLIDDCDVLAAHPTDPRRMADGVADDLIVPRIAISACEEAIESGPGDPRFVFQLGRALLNVGREEEAFALFLQASETDYAAAWAYLGDAYQFGLGTSVDGEKALDAYQKSLDLGFLEAESQIDQLTFDGSLYAMPFVSHFFQGKYQAIEALVDDADERALNRNYVFNLVQTLLLECEPFLEPRNVPALYEFRYPPGWTEETDRPIAVAIQTNVAEYDAATFLRRHGCDGLIAEHIFRSINLYLSTNP